jgi:DNA-binding NarL/FixJ family response regulator
MAIRKGSCEVENMRVLIADDHAAVRQSLAQALEWASDVEVVGEAPDGAAAVRLTQELQPDIVIMDIVMPQLDGIEATRRIVRDCPRVHVIGLSVHASKAYAARMLEAGASACVLKDGDTETLLHAMEAASNGRAPVSDEITPCDTCN